MIDVDWFSFRDATPAHNDFLSTVNPLVASDQNPFRPNYPALDELFQTVFDEQPIVFDALQLGH